MKKSGLIILLLLLSVTVGWTQKKALSFDDIDKWQRITETIVSDDGELVAYKLEPWKGDTEVKLYKREGKEVASFPNGTGLSFSSDSRFLFMTEKTSQTEVRDLKLKKTKRDDMPKDKLIIYDIKGSTISVSDINTFKVPVSFSGWFAYQVFPGDIKADSLKAGAKKQSDKDGYELVVRNLVKPEMSSFPFVKQFAFSKDGKSILFVTTGDGDKYKPGLYTSKTGEKLATIIFEGKGDIKQLRLSDDGSEVAFIYNDNENDKSGGGYALYFSKDGLEAEKVVSSATKGIQEGWIVSPDRRVDIEEETGRLYFGTAPESRIKDSTRLEDEVPVVDIWHWKEGKLHTQQVVDRASDLKDSFMGVYHIGNKSFVQLATPTIPVVSTINEGKSDWVVGMSNLPYELQSMWEGSPNHFDVYLINSKTGASEMIKKDLRAYVSSSPSGKYLYWYNALDTTWNSYNIVTRTEKKITIPSAVMVADEMDDSPNFAGSYSAAGWLADDKAILIYDRYDVWRVDPDGVEAPVNITINGRKNRTVYRVIRTSQEERFFEFSEPVFLSGFNEVSRHAGYFRLKNHGSAVPEVLLTGPFATGRPVLSKNSSTLVYTRETFSAFPDLLVTDLTFKKSVKISSGNPQQNQFNWGTVELVSWTSLDGRPVEGLLYKPENFDPGRKYPMIVNFYDRSSEGLYNYKNPEPHRSTIDYHYYTSNGYLVFNPDVHYIDGYPGESAFNCIMPGITALIAKGYVKEDGIGAQGHSWGGYQVAYLATRTSLFAAIESGAPVVNMFSAYGGIRWGSGLNRAFQYEQDQSRIGKSIWESPLRYIENSPLFTMDKVTTPILIMANDNDGHVPWYQGIEYFIALRRLGKPSWLLNYTGEVHWPQKHQNKKDFQIRMAQFFDHYLKGEPMPKWMKDGIPAVDRDFELGYGF